MTHHQDVQRAQEAAQVLDNPAYKAAMSALRSEIVAAWKHCPVRDAEGQRLLLQLIKMADKFEAMLNGAIETGKFAQHQIRMDELRNESKARSVLRRIA